MDTKPEWTVVKRDGSKEPIQYDKILKRLQHLKDMHPFLENVNVTEVTQKVIAGVYDGVHTSDLDKLASETAAYMNSVHPEYAQFAARIAISDLQKNTSDDFMEVFTKELNYVHPRKGISPLISREVYSIISKNKERIKEVIDYDRDFNYDFFGFKTLVNSYLARCGDEIVERPTHMMIRVAFGVHKNDVEEALRSYDLMSRLMFTFATPTLFNAGTTRPQMSSCFLLTMKDDSIEAIYDTLKQCALISKSAGGIGLSVHKIRGSGSYIRGANGGNSDGLVPMLKVYNDTARYVDQCFAPGTIVHTSKGPRNIETIKLGDKLLTASGHLQPVERVLEHEYDGSILRVSIKHITKSVLVTPQHQVLVLKNRSKDHTNAKMVDADDLLVGDFVCFPIPKGGKIVDIFPSVPNKKDADYLVRDGAIYSRITKIVEESYTGKVYDFEVAKEHTYVSGMGTVHNGGGKRKGAFAIYLEPWHTDIFEFLELKKNIGKDEHRCRDLFYGLWIPDLFMKRVENNENWSLFCPDEAPGLADCWGDEFEQLYLKYEKSGLARRSFPSQQLWYAILESQIETGTPYLLYKDAANSKSNQKNLGTIRNSNLCTEIIQYSSPEEIAVCNLASIALPKFVEEQEDGSKRFHFLLFMDVIKHMVRGMNKVVDGNYYPVPEAKRSNMRHRPIGLGVQGLADAFLLMRFAWESKEAAEFNEHIFAAMYYAALEQSCDLARDHEHYETFKGSPASEGMLQFDLWGVDPVKDLSKFSTKTTEPLVLDWEALKERIKKVGLRNSLLIAPMPTASTSQLLGNNECIEPYTSNIYTRRTSAGDFTVINKHLIRDLSDRGLWNSDFKNLLVAHKGSIQNISVIPSDIKSLYKTAWEIKQKTLVDMAARRGVYIDQSQSLNIFMADPQFSKVTSAQFYIWKAGLKGSYYLRTRPAADPISFTVD